MHDDHQDDDDQPLSREELNEKYLWKPGEREATEREMAERQRRIDRDETLAWAKRRADARQIPAAVTKSAPVTRPRPAAPAAPDWSGYIRGELNKRDRVSDRVMAKAIAQVLLTEEKARAAEINALRARVDELQERLDQLEAAPRTGLRAV